MSEPLTIEAALKKLKGLLPAGTFATVAVHQHGEMNRPANLLETVDSAEIYVEGGYWYRGTTLNEALSAFKQSQDNKESK